MPRYQGPAFILRKWDFGESDLLISFFDRGRGKRRGIAKGAKRSKKRFGGILSPLFLVQLDYFEKPGRSLVRIEGCTLIHYYSSFPSHLGKLLVGCCLLEIMERVLPEGEGGEPFFLLLAQTLECMDREEQTGVLLWVFLIRTLALLGVPPQLEICIHCRRPLAPDGVFGFSVPLGGPVCGGCVRKGTSTHRAHAETLRLMKRWLGSSREAFYTAGVPGRFVREAEAVIEKFYMHHVTREFRSLRVLKEISKRAEPNRKE